MRRRLQPSNASPDLVAPQPAWCAPFCARKGSVPQGTASLLSQQNSATPAPSPDLHRARKHVLRTRKKQRTRHEQICHGLYHKIEKLGLPPATCRDRMLRSMVQNHCLKTVVTAADVERACTETIRVHKREEQQHRCAMLLQNFTGTVMLRAQQHLEQSLIVCETKLKQFIFRHHCLTFVTPSHVTRACEEGLGSSETTAAATTAAATAAAAGGTVAPVVKAKAAAAAAHKHAKSTSAIPAAATTTTSAAAPQLPRAEYELLQLARGFWSVRRTAAGATGAHARASGHGFMVMYAASNAHSPDEIGSDGAQWHILRAGSWTQVPWLRAQCIDPWREHEPTLGMSKAEAAANAKAAEKSRAASAAAAPKHSSASKHKVGGGAVVAISLQLAGKSRKFFSSDPTAIGRVTHALASALSVLPSAVQLVQVRCGSRVANSCLITPPLYLVLGVMPSWQSHLRSTNTPSYYHPRCADHCCRR